RQGANTSMFEDHTALDVRTGLHQASLPDDAWPDESAAGFESTAATYAKGRHQPALAGVEANIQADPNSFSDLRPGDFDAVHATQQRRLDHIVIVGDRTNIQPLKRQVQSEKR